MPEQVSHTDVSESNSNGKRYTYRVGQYEYGKDVLSIVADDLKDARMACFRLKVKK